MTDADDVVGAEDRAGDPVSVDVCSVGAAVVDELPLVTGSAQDGVAARYQQVVEDDVVFGCAADRDDQLVDGVHRGRRPGDRGGAAGHPRWRRWSWWRRRRPRRRRCGWSWWRWRRRVDDTRLGWGRGGLDGRNQLQRLPGRRRTHQHCRGLTYREPFDSLPVHEDPVAAVVHQNPARGRRLEHRVVSRHPWVVQMDVDVGGTANRPDAARGGMPDASAGAQLQRRDAGRDIGRVFHACLRCVSSLPVPSARTMFASRVRRPPLV